MTSKKSSKELNRKDDNLLELYEHLAQSQDDIKRGKVENADSVFEQLKKELRNMDLKF